MIEGREYERLEITKLLLDLFLVFCFIAASIVNVLYDSVFIGTIDFLCAMIWVIVFYLDKKYLKHVQ